jgi:hypothetical protein
MKTLFREYKQVTRRLLLNAFGALAVVATGGSRVARAATPGRKGAPVQELCVECLAKRAMQRGAFINKWV